MKHFYSLLLLIAVFGITSQAQSLNPGQVSDNLYNKQLLVQRFSLGNAKAAAEKKAVSQADDNSTVSTGHKEINFIVNYDADRNSFSGTSSTDSIQERSPMHIGVTPHSQVSRGADVYQLQHINFMQLKLALGSENAALTISNLKLNGVDITGSYTANTSGEIYWHLIYGEFGSNFSITGTINILNNSTQLEGDNEVELGFGSSFNLSPTALSVFWGEVNAGQKNKANIINWNTHREENNDRFIVERSVDGLNFTGIGLVTGAGNRSTPSAYNFSDNEFTEGDNYYRIKQVDMDGHASYSVVVHMLNNSVSAAQATTSNAGLVGGRVVKQRSATLNNAGSAALSSANNY